MGDKKVRAHLSEKRLLRIPPRKLFCAIGIEQFCAAQFSEGLEGGSELARENRALSLSPLSAVISREEEFCQTAQSRVKRKRGRKEGRERERAKQEVAGTGEEQEKSAKRVETFPLRGEM